MIKTSGSAGTTIKLTDASGNTVVSYSADQSFSCIIISHPSITKGSTYTLTVGLSTTTITMNSIIYSSGGSSGGGMGGRK